MTVEIKQIDDTITGILSGRLDTAASGKCADDLKELFDNADKTLALDCKDMEFISSSGLRIFLTLRKAVSAKGGSLTLLNLNDDVRNIFDLTKFSKIFVIK